MIHTSHVDRCVIQHYRLPAVVSNVSKIGLAGPPVTSPRAVFPNCVLIFLKQCLHCSVSKALVLFVTELFICCTLLMGSEHIGHKPAHPIM